MDQVVLQLAVTELVAGAGDPDEPSALTRVEELARALVRYLPFDTP